MQSKKWVIWCVFVGIVGGAFLMVSPVGLLAAGIGSKWPDVWFYINSNTVYVFGDFLCSFEE